MARAMRPAREIREGKEDPYIELLTYTVCSLEVASGPEALRFRKLNTLFPTYALMQKTWNKVRKLAALKVSGTRGYGEEGPV